VPFSTTAFVITDTLFTDADDDVERPLPDGFCLFQNYPNPFNAATTITYELPARAHVVVEIFDLLGRKIRELEAGVNQPGVHALTWNGTDAGGAMAVSGVYFCRLRVDGHSQVRKMLLLK